MSAARTFNRGDTVYSTHGQEGVYVARCSGGHIVEPVYDSEDGEPAFGEPTTWRDVFAKPPTERLEHEVAALEAKLQLRHQELNALRDQRTQFEREEAARKERLKQHEQLAALDDYLAGRITHFVVTSEYDAPSIVTFDEAMRTVESGDKNLRLLGLFGDPKRNLRWRVMYYSDGSGSTKYEVFPCTSLEQATARLTDLVNNGWDKVRSEGRIHLLTKNVELARRMGLSVPDDIAAKSDQLTNDAYLKAVKCRREAAEKAQRELAEAEAAARAAGLEVGSTS